MSAHPKFLMSRLIAVTLFLDFVTAAHAEPGDVVNGELAETDLITVGVRVDGWICRWLDSQLDVRVDRHTRIKRWIYNCALTL